MSDYKKIIFVDEDDNSRAPMAKIIMKSKFLLKPLDIESRGMVVLFPEPINQKAEAVLISNGYSVAGHEARQLTQEDLSDEVLILTMESGQKERIWANYEHVRHMYTLTEYIRIKGELPSLYGEPLKEYGKCYETLEHLIDGLVIRLNEETMLSQ